MTFETVDNILTISTDTVMTTAMAGILLLIGFWIKKKVTLLDKYCIPAPVVGGFLFMFITWAGYSTNTFTFNFTNTFQDPFMLAFFTTVGLGASFSLLKKGGVLLIIYWLTAGIISIFQNVIGIAVGTAVGLPAPYALLSSAISMIGGHGAALSYGSTFVKMGYDQGQLVGAAAATFGLISAVLIGGPVGRRLIVKYDLKPEENNENYDDIESVNAASGAKLTGLDVIKNVVVILVCMAVGTVISGKIGQLIDMSFPTYVGAMFVAVIVRNLNDRFHLYNFSFSLVDGIGDVMLNLYLGLALMTLKLWELAALAVPMIVTLLVQTLIMFLFTSFIVFRVMGRDYEAACMTTAFCGFGMGATPNAMANMLSVTGQYGPAPKAFFVVPIVGGMFVDFTNTAVLSVFLNFLPK